MSEQETSRSVGSSSSSSSVSEGGEERNQRQEEPNQGPLLPSQLCAVLDPCVNNTDDGGMGNRIFSSFNDYSDTDDNFHDKKSQGCDSFNEEKKKSQEDNLSDSGVVLSYKGDTMHLNHEPSQLGEDNGIPSSEQALDDNVTIFKKRTDTEVKLESIDAVNSEIKTNSDKQKHDDGASQELKHEDYKNVTDSTEHEKICDTKDNDKSTCGEVTVKDAENLCQSDESCQSQVKCTDTLETQVKCTDTLETQVKCTDTLETQVKCTDTLETQVKCTDTLETQMKCTDTLETQEVELAERGEGIVVLSKYNNETLPNTDSNGCDRLSVPVLQSHNQDTPKINPLGNTVESCTGTSIGIVNNEGIDGYSLDTTVSTSNVTTESDSIGLMQMCSVGVDDGFNVVVQGCSSMNTMKTDPNCYTPGMDMCVSEAVRGDTDSEAGDSCCSDEEHHGEACRGENGCIHRVAGDTLEQNWDYMVDEEFNVPRKPIFNGSAEQLERRSSLKRKASEEPEESKPAKCKRGIQFEGVTVFYFPRSQGFTCVPSQGGSSLGMSRRHSHIRQFSLAEHAVEQRRAHREYLMRLRQQRTAREHGESSSRGSSSEDSEENSEEPSDLSDSELDADSYYFLQPLPIRQRRALLRQAGICHIEGLEKEECKDIRMSREMCGCQCKVYCDPDTCQCAQAGIKCQVDRHNFPCGCSREGCGNSYGRIEFNPIRVRTHFISTLMRLELEKRHSQQQLQHQRQQHHQHQHQHQQQEEWHQQQQQQAKLLAGTSGPANGFSSSSGGGLTGGYLPFYGSRDTSGLSVADVNKFNSTVEMGACVGSMNTSLYPHFESRQMLGPGAPSVYIQHDSVGDYNSGTCSVFGGLGATFDPSGGAYGSCHSFPSAGPQVGPQVAPQVAPTQPPPPEAYNSLSKFTNSTTSLVSTSFPYSGGVAAAPSTTATVPTVNCSYPQNNFCMTAVHDNTNGTVFGQYHEGSTITHNLFKAGGVNECGGGSGGDFQPNFEALSSSPASTDNKAGRYIAPPSLLGPGKEMCSGGSGGMVVYPTEASASIQCPSEVIDNTGYNKMAAAVSGSAGGGSSSCSSSCSSTSPPHHNNTITTTTTTTTAEDAPDFRLPHHHHHHHLHQQLPVSSALPVASLSYSDHSNPVKDSTPGTDDPSTDTTENLGEIVKKSMVETVSA
ncbi:hypothetical protein Pmani_003823 [Petrolisthes manimaculis]|uniref:Cysteine/serine-rich nuclear protein N-terminal domain-containing protein n=1 Tax=Petrolisthes manimaculis TaxID=1843537 RepID=A0AAE1QFU3_9EUCA|nr:hypothetical protein Pmani_003823 [Petrolisthes manimaculis]